MLLSGARHENHTFWAGAQTFTPLDAARPVTDPLLRTSGLCVARAGPPSLHQHRGTQWSV